MGKPSAVRACVASAAAFEDGVTSRGGIARKHRKQTMVGLKLLGAPKASVYPKNRLGNWAQPSVKLGIESVPPQVKKCYHGEIDQSKLCGMVY